MKYTSCFLGSSLLFSLAAFMPKVSSVFVQERVGRWRASGSARSFSPPPPTDRGLGAARMRRIGRACKSAKKKKGKGRKGAMMRRCPATASPTPSPVCDLAVLLQSNAHLYFLGPGGLTFPEAEEYAAGLPDCCGGRVAHLVTITSETEQAFVQDLVEAANATMAWIGYTDEAEEGTFQWVTGEISNYTNWYIGQPNNLGFASQNADCTFMDVTDLYGGSWLDDNCWNFIPTGRTVVEYDCAGG